MLQAAGHRVGLYTSPHLVEFSERIRVDGRMISEADIGRFAEVVQKAAEPDLSPTFFGVYDRHGPPVFCRGSG